METEPTDWILLSPVGIQPGSSFSAGLSLQARSERGPKTDDSKVFPFAAQLKKPAWRSLAQATSEFRIHDNYFDFNNLQTITQRTAQPATASTL